MEIKLVTVIGSGIMGRGIAQVCAQGGYQVQLNDISREVLIKAREVIVKNLSKGDNQAVHPGRINGPC
ncbi:MAG: hypothetical protein VR66_23695 [Peptococcaceae bacterium BRH_c23]|nr:3-hydroxyacyl-CoA dehydrogenase NAD-binding domain-containing protein [Desulfosporosinus sp. BICA1-9]KJS46746.1 MAG: hypothetical protein VR66_23695 [Peptococcaceae bacterium BRH_c23]KJS82359.1 MAG: hypothetical protein JL57_24495 [Desulfosporosinus sp. BICA1-9]HBW35800.1 hypothetical protein [Desulfosporosinus sp.]